MAYWLENVNRCPVDDFLFKDPNKYVHHNSAKEVRIAVYECPICRRIYLKYPGAQLAAATDTSTYYLSAVERGKVKSQKEEKQRAAWAAKQEQDRLEKQRFEELRKAAMARKKARAEQEEKERAEQAVLKAKKGQLIAQLSSLFESDYFSAESFFKEKNNEQLLSTPEFRKLQVEYVGKWFSVHAPKGTFPPDKDQSTAIGSTRKNIEVVARAGSGKTSTIINRFRFLTEHCQVRPSTVLMLAFNKKAAEELREKIKDLYCSYDERERKMPHVMTFHALAYSIVHPEETLIYDDEDAGTRTLSRTVQGIIDEKIRDDTWASKIREVMLLHFKGNWEAIVAGGHNLSKEQQLTYLRSVPNQTLNNEYVKSHGEKVIANFLFEHDIEYTYEKYYKLDDGTAYRPDFTVYTADKKPIIIEYFGMTGDPTYDLKTAQKENYCATHSIPLMKVFPADVAGDASALTKELLGKLTEYGVSYRKLTEDEIWDKIKKRAIDEFTKAITSFIGRCRKKDLSVEALNKQVQNYSSKLPTEALFLELASNIFGDYLDKLKRDNLEDFDGLISRASKNILEGKTGFDKGNNKGDLRELSFIMIDEYQDFSFLFDRFLDTIRSVCPQASIFCVGDDWQAINAFAGSDVRYFQDFTQRYKESDRYYLRTNYRSKKEIVSIATRLMTKTGNQDSIHAAKSGSGTVRIGYLSDFELAPVEKAIHDYDRFTPAILRLVARILDQGKNVVFLTRVNDRLPVRFICRTKIKGSYSEQFVASVRTFFTPEKRLTKDNKERITTSTTHKYKGKENDVVIILDAMTGFYPLIHPAWIFQRVFGDSIGKLIEEERRLFYVALSRAKDDLYILTTRGEQSPFLSDLGPLKTLNWDDYSPVKTDPVGIKIEVCNQPGYYGTPPTMLIKELLKASAFKWDGKVWYRFYSRDDYDIAKIMEQAWTPQANHVILKQYGDNDRIENTYLFADGNVIRLAADGKTPG